MPIVNKNTNKSSNGKVPKITKPKKQVIKTITRTTTTRTTTTTRKK
jgi:hypothetical protein